jgi:hypothetical protein
MKELETHLKLERQNTIELNVKKKQEIEYVLQGTIKPQTGHFVWELNEETGEIKKAEFKQDTFVYGAELPPEELLVKSNCVYIPALNAENAKKKYLKNKEQSAYYVKQPPMNFSDLSFK